MKIEKLNDFQIRCTLTAEDLKENQVGLTDIVFCSDKARSLLRNMMQHASDDFGFDFSSSPSIMVEMRATSPENLVLTLTKMNGSEDMRRYMTGLASGMSGAFGSFPSASSGDGSRPYLEKYKNMFDKFFHPINSADPALTEGIRSFRFDSLDDVISASKAAGAGFSGINSLYRFGNGSNYQLLVHCEKENAEEFASVCDTLSEYGLSLTCTPATENYLKEHGGLIIENNALQQLAYL